MASGINALDMALDDVISQTGTNKRRQQSNRGRGGISKPSRGGFRSGNNSYSRAPYGSRQQDRNAPSSQPAARTSRTNLIVSNLHYNVTESDLYELFGQMGPVKRAFLHLGPSGGSAGVADIVFSYPPDAERALASYNNVELDGRPMRIAFATLPGVAQQQQSGGPMRRPMRGSNRPQRGRGGNRRRENRPKPSEEELDAEMDSYMAGPNDDQ
ncbi:hypothetical protein O0I10_001896 [Lichtheimia ornata]|uniref:RRM domain-containing protein n=1 Tax=Lichtheimia ornata TaxID=688661 RepID=A0AAD7VBL7_9FUNG|nr:uncharacterized protein O0I10_001896 [Lichtheimia ornata]KAJ8662203.1 hypothetical protein O0I10_001896 [Lichtheimia ornata]